MLSAVRLWKNMRVCSFVCRTWRDALQPFSSLTKICHRALQIPALSEESLKTLKLPTVPEAVRAITFGAGVWNVADGREAFRITESTLFKGKAWPAQISRVELMIQIDDEEDFRIGPSAALLNKYIQPFLKFAKKMLPIPQPWRTKPFFSHASLGETMRYRFSRFAICELQAPVLDQNKKSSGVLVLANDWSDITLFSDDATIFASRDWEPLHPLLALAPLLSQGLRFLRITPSWSSSRMPPKRPTDPCECNFPECKEASPCERCKKDVEGRRRMGHSHLFCGYLLEFKDGRREILLEIEVKILPFHSTSNDFALVSELESLLPWCGSEDSSSEAGDDDEDHSDDDESDEDQADVEDEDDGEDAEEEDAESDAESDGEAEGRSRSDEPLRRRLRGKQPPPPAWRWGQKSRSRSWRAVCDATVFVSHKYRASQKWSKTLNIRKATSSLFLHFFTKTSQNFLEKLPISVTTRNVSSHVR